MNNSIIY